MIKEKFIAICAYIKKTRDFKNKQRNDAPGAARKTRP
jgi:hypothetical protein